MVKDRIITDRLVLRSITDKDLKDLIENINNLNISKYLLVVPYPYTKKDAKYWINHCSKEMKKKSRKSCEFVIELKSEKRLIGGIGLSKIDNFQGKAEIGYWIGEKYWRQGIGSEALKVLLDFAFDKLKLRRLEANVYTENEASARLLEKFGFVKEGLGRKSQRCKATGKIHDSYFYGLLKEDYKR